MEKKYEFGNAFQPSELDEKKNAELKNKYRYQTWVPESVIAVGDSYVFYDDIEDLEDFGMGLYEHVKSVFNNPSYTKNNTIRKNLWKDDFDSSVFKEVTDEEIWDKKDLSELCKLYWLFQKEGNQSQADKLLIYVKENFHDMR